MSVCNFLDMKGGTNKVLNLNLIRILCNFSCFGYERKINWTLVFKLKAGKLYPISMETSRRTLSFVWYGHCQVSLEN